MVKIWLNHWFSTAFSIIELIKEADPSWFVIGTNERARSVMMTVCDAWFSEPDLKGDAYVDWALSFCGSQEVKVFLPRREMPAISRRKAEFEAIGVSVMADDYEIVSLLNDKARAYRYLTEKGVSTIPPWHVVSDLSSFDEAVADLSGQFDQICSKFVHDEGGKSFRLIDERKKGYEALFKKQSSRMPLADLRSALSERESFSPLMVMPYLPGEEASVDCLMTNQGLIMLPRIKDASRIERMSYDEEILEKTREVYDAVKLSCPCNIQFKYLEGRPYFLEVNTRMSGGVQMACAAAKVNIPGLAVARLLGIDLPWEIQRRECYVSHIEKPLVLLG